MSAFEHLAADKFDLDQLHAWLQRRAKLGKWLPSTPLIAEMVPLADSPRVTELLWLGQHAGLWVVQRSSSRHVTEIVAADGSWRIARDTVPQRPPRRCLACRSTFAPAHRYNFLCCDREAA